MSTNSSATSNNAETVTNTVSIANDFKTNLIEQIAKNAGAGLNALRASNVALGATLDLIGGSSWDEAGLKAVVGGISSDYAVKMITQAKIPYLSTAIGIAIGATYIGYKTADIADKTYQYLKKSYTGSNDYFNTVLYPYTAIKATENYLAILGAQNINGAQCSANFGILNSIKNLGSALNHASPLAIDLDGDGIESTNMKDGVFFDIKNTGFQNKIAIC